MRRLKRDGLIRDFDGRGYVTGGDAAPVRIDLAEAGLRLPAALAGDLKIRNRRERIYPEVEHTVAACLSYGRFLLNESGLAEHHGVSRTVAHEVLTRLERTGLVTQDVNQRWYAGPLTAELLREHYEMRWLLEPIALGQALPGLDATEIAAKLRAGREGARQPPQAAPSSSVSSMISMSTSCSAAATASSARPSGGASCRSSPPIPPSSASRIPHEIETMVAEHVAILWAIRDGRRAAAMAALEGPSPPLASAEHRAPAQARPAPGRAPPALSGAGRVVV